MNCVAIAVQLTLMALLTSLPMPLLPELRIPSPSPFPIALALEDYLVVSSAVHGDTAMGVLTLRRAYSAIVLC